MKSIGIIRRLDSLGRLVLPVELRRAFDLRVDDPVEIYVEGDKIILKKYHPECVFCNENEDLMVFKGKSVCRDCAKALEK